MTYSYEARKNWLCESISSHIREMLNSRGELAIRPSEAKEYFARVLPAGSQIEFIEKERRFKFVVEDDEEVECLRCDGSGIVGYPNVDSEDMAAARCRSCQGQGIADPYSYRITVYLPDITPQGSILNEEFDFST